MKKDNAGLSEKVRLRRQGLAVFTALRKKSASEKIGTADLALNCGDLALNCGDLVCLETHGGVGVLYQTLYRFLPMGLVWEKNNDKAERLARQRPDWRVYEGDALPALKAGVGAELAPAVIDVDPYGDPWPFLSALLSGYLTAPLVLLMVNDGLRQKVKMGGAWHAGSLRDAVRRRGNDLHDDYLAVCEEMMTEKAAQAGYALDCYEGFYGGHAKQMTHYYAILSKLSS